MKITEKQAQNFRADLIGTMQNQGLNGKLSVSKIADIMCITTATAVAFCKAMEKYGLEV